MEEIIDLVFWIVGAVVTLTVIYHVAPFRAWKNKRPKLAFFPKYLANYAGDINDVIANIKEMGFESDENWPNIFSRGKLYGDFSAKSMKLRIEIIEPENSLKVYAPFTGVFFDTSDLWSITSNAIRVIKP